MSVDFRDVQGTIFVDPNNELYHSGIKGMKWGIRKYQNKDGSLTPAGKIRYNMGSRQNSRRSDRKFTARINKSREKARMVALEKARIAKAEKKIHDVEKEKALREGTAEEVLKYRNEISNTELANALNRIKWTRELDSIAQKEKEKGWDTVDNVMKKVGKVSSWTKTGVDAYNNAQSIKKIFDNFSKISEIKPKDLEKERVLREGNAEEVLKYRNKISNTELADALNRIKWTRELSDIIEKEKKSK